MLVTKLSIQQQAKILDIYKEYIDYEFFSWPSNQSFKDYIIQQIIEENVLVHYENNNITSCCIIEGRTIRKFVSVRKSGGDKLLKEIILLCQSQNWEYIKLRVSNENFKMINLVVSHGFKLIQMTDKKSYFEYSL